MKNLQFKINLAADTDAYKQHHHKLINPELSYQYTYGESRIGSKYPATCFFGLQALIQQYFMDVPTQEDIEEARQLYIDTNGYDEFDVETWEKVRKLGYLPMVIKAVPEGTIVPIDNVLFTTESTEPWFAKTLNSLETLTMHIWYATTVATRAMLIKKSIIPYFQQTGSLDSLAFAVNDFGVRGVASYQQAVIGGMASLLFTNGSDNLPASRWVKRIYGDSIGPAKSIRATEHSVALSYGKGEGELKYFKQILDQTHPDYMFACVIDTYDAHGFIRNVAGNDEIKQRIIDRNGRVVFRPDSGDPMIIVPQLLELLGEIYGYSINLNGYKVLRHNVGLIQGDGMDEESIPKLYETVMRCGWASSNLAVGSGGGLLQKDLNRDTQRFAIKPSFGIINNEEFNFKKNPMTDTTKSSKSGKLKLHPSMGNFRTISSAIESKAMFNSYVDALVPYFVNGELVQKETFEQIRARANSKFVI